MASSPEEILSSLASSSSSTSIEDTTSKLTSGILSLVEGGSNDKAAEDYLWNLWNELLRKVLPSVAIARGTTYGPFPQSENIDRAVELIGVLKTKPVTEVTVWGDRRVRVWQDLPLLGAQIREMLDADPTRGLRGDRSPTEDQSHAWIVQISFLARLMAAEILPLDHTAIWILREGLEEEASDDARGTRASAAASVLYYCRDTLLKKSRANEQPNETQTQYTRPGRLYTGPAWYCQERWNFWMGRLAMLYDGDLIAGKDKARIGLATEGMKASEK